MTFTEKKEYKVQNWTYIQCDGNIFTFMRRELRIRVTFEPVRMGTDFLHQAYELIAPVHQRRLTEEERSVESAEVTTEMMAGRCGEEGSVS